MATEQLAYEDLQEDVPESGRQGKLKCAFCPETFDNGRNRYNHERAYHPDEFRRNSPDGRRRGTGQHNRSSSSPPREEREEYRVVTIAGVRMDTVHDTTRKFAETLENVAHDMNPGKKKQIILAFDDIAFQVNQDPSKLERFLNRCGVSASQAEYIKLVLLGLDDDKPPWGREYSGRGPDGTQVMTWDPQTGRMAPAPIFFMGGQSSTPHNPTGPMVIMPPWYGGNGPGEHLTRRDVEDYVDRVIERFQPAQPREQPANPGMRRYQRPVVGSDGKVMVDPTSGAPLMAWVEEPLDPFGDTLNKLTNLGLIGKPETPPPSAEEIGQAVALQIQGLMPQDNEKNVEIAELRKDFQAYIHKTELKEAERSGAQAVLAEYQHTIQPYLDELKELRGRTGLSDRQYELKHQENVLHNFLGGVNNALNGLRADLQPLAVQNMVATMKQMGVSDNVINETIRRLPMPGASGSAGGEEDVRAAMMQKWVNE